MSRTKVVSTDVLKVGMCLQLYITYNNYFLKHDPLIYAQFKITLLII